MMLLEMELLARERHERIQREAAQAHHARRLGPGRPDQVNRPNRMKLFIRT
jgi:hypothetical protein